MTLPRAALRVAHGVSRAAGMRWKPEGAARTADNRIGSAPMSITVRQSPRPPRNSVMSAYDASGEAPTYSSGIYLHTERALANRGGAGG